MKDLTDTGVATRLDGLDWAGLLHHVDADGYALSGPVLTPTECEGLVGLYGDDARFRSRIDMKRYRFGVGDYGYFAHPLPPFVQSLRQSLYARLAPLANLWASRLRGASPAAEGYPPLHDAFLRRCHEAGQLRPTPLLLRYENGGYNCLHQDLYGAVAFPLQATVFLSQPGLDYRGGEFLLVEQRPRQQSRGTALIPERGTLVVFPSSERPVPSQRGYMRVRMRHGVSTVTAGRRFTLGIVFHDAE